MLSIETVECFIAIHDFKPHDYLSCRFQRIESRGTNGRRISKHNHDSDYKLVHACKIVSCQKIAISRQITRYVPRNVVKLRFIKNVFKPNLVIFYVHVG